MRIFINKTNQFLFISTNQWTKALLLIAPGSQPPPSPPPLYLSNNRLFLFVFHLLWKAHHLGAQRSDGLLLVRLVLLDLLTGVLKLHLREGRSVSERGKWGGKKGGCCKEMNDRMLRNRRRRICLLASWSCIIWGKGQSVREEGKKRWKERIERRGWRARTRTKKNRWKEGRIVRRGRPRTRTRTRKRRRGRRWKSKRRNKKRRKQTWRWTTWRE